MPLAAGTRLGAFEIVGPLGAGGMGEVYRARDPRLKRDVAIKILPPHLSADPEFRLRFEREAHAISSLQHPNICVLHDVGRDPESGLEYLVLEHLEGETLAKRIAGRPLPVRDVLAIGAEISGGLARAHAAGIVHRDLKPANVMLTATGAKLLDFGLAKPAHEPVAPENAVTASMEFAPVTREGMLVGTIDYMSPEQVEGLASDERSDVFAFGVMLYEMITGRRPFAAPTLAATVASILRTDPPPLRELRPDCPEALQRVVLACLAKDPAHRWRSAADLRTELLWIAADLQNALSAPGAAARITWRRIASAALVLLVAGAALVFIAARGKPAPALAPMRIQVPLAETAGVLVAGERAGPAMLSPDGARLTYTALPPDGKHPVAWVHDLASGEATPLKGTDNATFPFWSGDGRSIGFFVPWARDGQGQVESGSLSIVDVASGSLRVAGAAPAGRGGAISRRGDVLFARSVTGGLTLLPRDGSGERSVTTPDAGRGERTHRWPQFLPDGERFLYFSLSSEREHTGTYLGSLTGESPRLLLAHTSAAIFAEPGALLWVRQGQLLAQPFDARAARLRGAPTVLAQGVHDDAEVQRAALSAAAGVLVYHRPSKSTGQRPRLQARSGEVLAELGDAGPYGWLRLSPDGRRLAFQLSISVTEGSLWSHDLERGTRTRVTPTRALAPAWSPDGSQLAFAAQGSGAPGALDLFVQSGTGYGAPKLLLSDEYDKRALSWSSDGRYLVHIARKPPSPNWDIRVLVLGERRVFTLVEGPQPEVQPQLSPDGRWLAYAELNQAAPAQVFVVPFPDGGQRYQVSIDGGDSPRWSHDGRELFFVGGDGFLQAVAVDARGGSPAFSSSQRLFRMPSSQFVGFTYDVLPGSQKFVVIHPEFSGSTDPLQGVVQWDRLLSR